MAEQRINIMETPSTENAAAPATKTLEVSYASLTERFVALLIDYGVVFIPFRLLVGLWLKISNPELEVWQYFGLVGLMNGLFILYVTIFSCGDRMTLGKALVGIAVVKKDLSGPISFPKAFIRTIGYYISGALLMCGFLMAFFDDRRRSLHDMLGGSVVVQIRPKTFMEQSLLRVIGAVLLFTFIGTLYTQFFSRGALLDQYYIRQARIHLHRVALLEDVHKAKYGYYTNDLLRLALLSGDPVQFQRDIRKAWEPKGFKIGVSKTSYKISAVAKDNKHTRVAYSPAE